MHITYGNEIQQHRGELALLQQATAQVEELMGHSVVSVAACWDRHTDPLGRVTYTLTVRGEDTEERATFSPRELASPGTIRSRLLDLWGDFLELRSAAQLKTIQQLVLQGQ